MIELIDITKQFKDNIIFKDINLEIPSGSRAFIQGANGSGKSVLLRMISGYLTPTAGEIIIDGEILGNKFDFILNAGIFIDAPEFMPNWTGEENLLYLAKFRNIATKESIYQLAKEFGLQNDLSKKYKTYSLGMRQKLRLIQALMDEPKYLILDEPFDALDKESRNKVLVLLDDYLNEDKERTIIYTSHNDSMEDFSDITFDIIERTITKVQK